MSEELNVRERIRSRIELLRKRQGLTQARLGQMARIDAMSIKHIEGGIGNLSVRQLQRLADALGVESYLLICPFALFKEVMEKNDGTGSPSPLLEGDTPYLSALPGRTHKRP